MTATSTHADQFEAQRAYYATRQTASLLAIDTPYIHRHFSEVVEACGLGEGARVCEWGSGLGRFSRLLLARGFEVTAIELSPRFAAESSAALGADPMLDIRCGDIAETLAGERESHDAMLGFFVLHHLPELASYFRAAHAALKPGGRFVFAEPNPLHPLYPVQIAFTPGMRWAAERGIYNLTRKGLASAAAAAGFRDFRVRCYGALPRAPYNLAARAGLERAPEWFVPAPIRPFQLIEATK